MEKIGRVNAKRPERIIQNELRLTNAAKFCIHFIFIPMLRTNMLGASFFPSRKSII